MKIECPKCRFQFNTRNMSRCMQCDRVYLKQQGQTEDFCSPYCAQKYFVDLIEQYHDLARTLAEAEARDAKPDKT